MTSGAALAGTSIGAAVLSAACGQSASTGGGPGTAKPGAGQFTGKLEVWDWWNIADSPTHDEWFKWVKEHFEKKYAGAEYQYVYVPFGEYLDKLTAAAAGGTPPDALHSSVAFARDYWDRGILAELNAYVARTPDMAMSKFLKASQFTNQKAGKLFGVPMEGPDAAVIGYNEDALREVGLDPSPAATAKWTWQDFVANAQKLTKKAGGVVQRAGFDAISGGIAGFTYWLYTNGGQLYNADQTKVAFNDAKGQATLQMMQDVQTKHGVRFGEGQAPQVAKGSTLFYQGYTAMTNLGTWSINYVTENVKELKWNMMAYPKGPDGKSQATTTWMNMVVMPKEIKNPELAWTFMAWFSGMDAQINRMKIISRVAPRYDFFESKEFKEEATKVKQLAEVPRIAELGGSYPFIRNGLFNKEVGPILNDAINGKLGVRAALAQAEDKANQILADAAAGR